MINAGSLKQGTALNLVDDVGKLRADLVMWTYNSANVLDKSLPSIEKAIPEENVCHKIAVDGGSRDHTLDVLREYGWDVSVAPRKGIPYQANYALAKVDSEYFGCFEHDIILNSNWFDRTSKLIYSDTSIGCVQGIRLYTGSKTMHAIEEWQYCAMLLPRWQYSIDNALCRTVAVRQAGGFSDECMASSDGILRRNMFKIGYKWITDYTLVSGHYRKDFLEQFKHQIRAAELARYTWSSNPETGKGPRKVLSMLGGNPRNVLKMTLQSRMLRVPIAWYILRYEKGLYSSLPHDTKSVKPVAMDKWYLEEFVKQVLATGGPTNYNRASPNSSTMNCAVCGKSAPYAYALPSGWGSVVPTFRRRMRSRFFACSVEHAGLIAENIFKTAFEYVTPDGSSS